MCGNDFCVRDGILDKLKGRSLSFVRKTSFLIANLVLRWPIWIFLFVFCRFYKPFSYVFLVYPGSDSDLDGYCPRWLAKSWLFSGKPTIGGFICGGMGRKGLVVVIPNTAKEFSQDKALCLKIEKRLVFIKNICGAKAIALAGQAPKFFTLNGLSLDKPFVSGTRGTVFCVVDTMRGVMKKHNLETGKFKIAVVGVGYVGGLILDNLKAKGHDIFGVDVVSSDKKEVLLKEESKKHLASADMVIVLTPKGTDFNSYVKYLKKGAVVVDDTHPKIIDNFPEFSFYKVAATMKGVKFCPKLPGYKKNWIPGCALEAIYSSVTDDFSNDQSRFNLGARDLGFNTEIK